MKPEINIQTIEFYWQFQPGYIRYVIHPSLSAINKCVPYLHKIAKNEPLIASKHIDYTQKLYRSNELDRHNQIFVS